MNAGNPNQIYGNVVKETAEIRDVEESVQHLRLGDARGKPALNGKGQELPEGGGDGQLGKNDRHRDREPELRNSRTPLTDES